MNGARWVNEPWVAGLRNYDSWPREVIQRLLAGCGYTKRRLARDVAKTSYSKVALDLGMREVWLRALLRELTPKPAPRTYDFVWSSTPGPKHFWIPLDIKVTP